MSIFRLRRDRSDEDYGDVSHLHQNDWIKLKNSVSIAVNMRAAISAQLRTDFAMTLGSACHIPSGAGG
jgi:hypothetical protein